MPVIDEIVIEEDDDVLTDLADNNEIQDEGQEVLVDEDAKEFSDKHPFGNY